LAVLEEIQGRHESRSIDVDLSIDDNPKDPHLSGIDSRSGFVFLFQWIDYSNPSICWYSRGFSIAAPVG
jgi:hypothetical protein